MVLELRLLLVLRRRRLGPAPTSRGVPDGGAGVARAHLQAAALAVRRVRRLRQLAPQPRGVVAGRVVPEHPQKQRAQLRHAQARELLAVEPPAADPRHGAAALLHKAAAGGRGQGLTRLLVVVVLLMRLMVVLWLWLFVLFLLLLRSGHLRRRRHALVVEGGGGQACGGRRHLCVCRHHRHHGSLHDQRGCVSLAGSLNNETQNKVSSAFFFSFGFGVFSRSLKSLSLSRDARNNDEGRAAFKGYARLSLANGVWGWAKGK